jgi:hypothetical protein
VVIRFVLQWRSLSETQSAERFFVVILAHTNSVQVRTAEVPFGAVPSPILRKGSLIRQTMQEPDVILRKWRYGVNRVMTGGVDPAVVCACWRPIYASFPARSITAHACCQNRCVSTVCSQTMYQIT